MIDFEKMKNSEEVKKAQERKKKEKQEEAEREQRHKEAQEEIERIKAERKEREKEYQRRMTEKGYDHQVERKQNHSQNKNFVTQEAIKALLDKLVLCYYTENPENIKKYEPLIKKLDLTGNKLTSVNLAYLTQQKIDRNNIYYLLAQGLDTPLDSETEKSYRDYIGERVEEIIRTVTIAYLSNANLDIKTYNEKYYSGNKNVNNTEATREKTYNVDNEDCQNYIKKKTKDWYIFAKATEWEKAYNPENGHTSPIEENVLEIIQFIIEDAKKQGIELNYQQVKDFIVDYLKEYFNGIKTKIQKEEKKLFKFWK